MKSQSLGRRLHSASDEFGADTEGSWAISYGDMITVLLGFFVVFFSLDSREEEQSDAIQESLRIALMTETPEEMSERARVKLGTQDGEAIDPIALTDIGAITVHKVGKKLLVEFPGISFFDSGETDVSAAGRATLQVFAKRYLPYAGLNVTSIRAYTDTRKVIPKEGRRFRDNLELSALRSVAAMRILQAAGIPLGRMKLGGYGELITTAREIANLPEGARGGSSLDLSRRVVLVVEPEERRS